MSVIESTIDGRYEVIARIASGGMGEVYRAHDAVLGREVALKVLHAQLAGDRGFVDRFRREARAAASLNHPNIVGVYDWGFTEGTYFMIMEFVPGTNLRSLLRHYGRLEPAQVVEVTLPVLAALDHAHGHGIVHRDVKPENILIARDGTVKVADFGLARAYAESYVSQAEGTVTGTVQYLAPEQIQGEPADPRTDLYAVGIVVFELLTGHAPFTGETSLAIAYQHLSASVPAPSHAEPTIESALDGVVLQATAKDPNLRPSSARAMRTEVAQAARTLPPAPPVAELAAQIPSVDAVTDDGAGTVTIPRRLTPRARRARRLRIVALIALLLGIIGVGAWAAWVYAVPHYTRVPNLAGLSETQAIARLKAAGLGFTLAPPEFSTSVASGQVIRAVPPAGTRMRTRQRVVVVTSKGPQLVVVPDVRGQPEATAQDRLGQAGLTPKVVRTYDEDVAKGTVISQSTDPGQNIVKGSSVTITVSLGPAPVPVPPLAGQPAGDAQAALEADGFAVTVAKQFSDTVPAGSVIGTQPASGTKIPRGSPVTLMVSKGPQTFPMPDVRGMTKEAATARLESLGLTVLAGVVPLNNPPDTVVFQDPVPGRIVHHGDAVTIYVTAR